MTFDELKGRMDIDLEGCFIDYVGEKPDFEFEAKRGLLQHIECWPNSSLHKIFWNRNRTWDNVRKRWKQSRLWYWYAFEYHDTEDFVGPFELEDGRIVFTIKVHHFVVYPRDHPVLELPPYLGDLHKLRDQATCFDWLKNQSSKRKRSRF